MLNLLKYLVKHARCTQCSIRSFYWLWYSRMFWEPSLTYDCTRLSWPSVTWHKRVYSSIHLSDLFLRCTAWSSVSDLRGQFCLSSSSSARHGLLLPLGCLSDRGSNCLSAQLLFRFICGRKHGAKQVKGLQLLSHKDTENSQTSDTTDETDDSWYQRLRPLLLPLLITSLTKRPRIVADTSHAESWLQFYLCCHLKCTHKLVFFLFLCIWDFLHPRRPHSLRVIKTSRTVMLL